ncbi:phosphoethanolamine transferase [Variovorax saccharolyticus]|uniref:phosphoethanolamine transferase n=1 Tax=Variovorax saccharolyticus TaxID=3053516 RepID=UPI00257589E1|nr:phosphoethanolamine transferase [Variovorax sp. J31P216]MDM0030032.1 phosphoethanolamine transferase [Variovorax sp. J31P216]
MSATAKSSSPAQRSTLLACAAVGATLLMLIALGHDGRRVAQLFALASPALVWLAWPVRGARAHRVRTCVVWLWAMGFALDGVIRAYLLDGYQAAPDSSLIQSAAANTNSREGAEYLSMHWRAMLVWSGALLAAGLALGRFAQRGARQAMAWPRWAVPLLCLALLVSTVAYLSKPWRRLHPVLFWSQWSQSVQALRAGWADQQQQRDTALARAAAAAPVVVQEGPATLVLVITDSINRDNMALYGYRRATTPRLLAHKAQLGDQMVVLRNAWSVDASTVPSLRNMFNFGLPPEQEPQHVLALARAAGYKVWWMSNHDDVAIEQQHARLADVVDIVNRTPGRAGASLDGELLDCVREALEDPAERKLIVVHLMGAHPHYVLRFPAGANPFDDQVDDVEAGLEKSGRSAWVRRFRQEYDAALLYHDSVVSETLQLVRTIGRADGYRAWMYLSDHGQEVGHGSNHAGHSPSTASGYRIPTVIWRNSAAEPYRAGTGDRPFRADWAGWTMADLLNIRWTGDATDRNALGEGYRWVAPVLPVKVSSFED